MQLAFLQVAATTRVSLVVLNRTVVAELCLRLTLTRRVDLAQRNVLSLDFAVRQLELGAGHPLLRSHSSVVKLN